MAKPYNQTDATFEKVILNGIDSQFSNCLHMIIKLEDVEKMYLCSKGMFDDVNKEHFRN